MAMIKGNPPGKAHNKTDTALAAGAFPFFYSQKKEEKVR